MSLPLLGGVHILLLDDDPQLLAAGLARQGARVSACGSIDEATQVARQGHVDVALIDHHLGLGASAGEQLARWLRAERPGVLRVSLSGDRTLSTLPAEQRGAYEVFLVKGAGNGPTQIARTLRQLLDQRQPRTPADPPPATAAG